MRLLRRNQSGMSLMELLVGVGILGLVTYFVAEMLKTGILGQKSLQAQDDSRTLTENMATLLGDPLACTNTFINVTSPNVAFSPPGPIQVQMLVDANRNTQFQPGKVYGNRSLTLTKITIGGTGIDPRTSIPMWAPSPATGTPTAGTAFVDVTWTQTGSKDSTKSGPSVLDRYFLVTFSFNAGTIFSCTAVTSVGGNGYWSFGSSGAIYNNNGNNAGPVGIGTQSPAGLFEVYDTVNGIDVLTVKPGGNVGVGTATPSNVPGYTALTIGSTASGGMLSFQQGTINRASIYNAAGANSLVTQSDSVYFNSMATPAKTSLFIDNTSGNVGIGTTSPAVALQVNGDVQGGTFISTSDERLKTDIRPVEGLAKILGLRGVEFTWRKTGAAGMGLIAQEVERVFPQIVATDKVTGYKAIRYESLIAPLVESVKDLYAMARDSSLENQRRFAALEAKDAAKDASIRELERRLDEHAKELAALKAKTGAQ